MLYLLCYGTIMVLSYGIFTQSDMSLIVLVCTVLLPIAGALLALVRINRK